MIRSLTQTLIRLFDAGGFLLDKLQLTETSITFTFKWHNVEYRAVITQEQNEAIKANASRLDSPPSSG